MARVRNLSQLGLFLLISFLGRYCKVLSREPAECYRCLSIPLLYNFFDWRLNQKVGKDGRKIRGTKKKSSLGTYWKVFRLVFERATGDKVDSKMDRSMHKVTWFEYGARLPVLTPSAGSQGSGEEARIKR